MDKWRIPLFMAFALVALFLWNAWQAEHPTKPTPVAGTTATPSQEPLLPQVTPSHNDSPTAIVPATEPKSLIQVKTDVLHLAIDLTHGDVVSAQLLHYPQSTEDSSPFRLLSDKPATRYNAGSNLFVTDQQNVKLLNINFTSQQQSYELKQGEKQLTVSLQGKTEDGLTLQKEFIFKEGSYLIQVRYHIQNQGQIPWKGYFNTQLLRRAPPEDKSSMFHIGSFTGASLSIPGKHRYQKISFADMDKVNYSEEAKGGWIAMQQHYFLTAWVPAANQNHTFYTRAANHDYSIGSVSEAIHLNPGERTTVGSQLYLGPENTQVLKSIAPFLDLTVDYGLLWFLSSILFSLMKLIYNVVGNWGWSIVLVTVLIKLAFYRLSATSYKSMAGMRKLQPKLQALRERYGDDKAKISQETMALYRQEKINPLGGCLPILIQIPVFIALYWVLLESVELRQAPFLFWIRDLSSADPYHVLPLIMGATMLVQQKLNPAPPDPMQAKLMMFLPILFTGLFWSFPAGLVLYWIVNNTLSILQQWYITRRYDEDKSAKPTKK
jgi:YidC/Oxa1 family membrane protein insertase